jgi:hypothetical protein
LCGGGGGGVVVVWCGVVVVVWWCGVAVLAISGLQPSAQHLAHSTSGLSTIKIKLLLKIKGAEQILDSINTANNGKKKPIFYKGN